MVKIILSLKETINKMKLEESPEIYYDFCVPKKRYEKNILKKYLIYLDNIYDKLVLCQWANNEDMSKEILSKISLDKYEKDKFNKLLLNNIDLYKTIDLRILNKKYEFLDNMLDLITTDMHIQNLIISLSDNRLELFKKIYLRLYNLVKNPNKIINIILKQISFFNNNRNIKKTSIEKLIISIEKHIAKGTFICDEEIDKIIFIILSDTNFYIKKYKELKKFNYRQVYKLNAKEFKEIEKRNNIIKLKDFILKEKFGLNYKSAITIIKKYNIKGLKKNVENRKVLEIYKEIKYIIDENKFNNLIEYRKKGNNYNYDYINLNLFENKLLKSFAEEINNKLYVPKGDNYELIRGVRVYNPGNNFKLMVTSLGAYQHNFKKPNNYFKYWNTPKIKNHINSCSLISNSNLSLAPIKNVILGFIYFDENMFISSLYHDMYSINNSESFSYGESNNTEIFTCQDTINKTRSNHNEYDYERKDLGINPLYCKKNPDYILFIEEYENREEYDRETLKDEKELWEESIKAAKNFNIPIVKINREKIAKNEIRIIETMLNLFEKALNPKLIHLIINRFENNRNGNSGFHKKILEKYFSKEKINNILKRIKLIIYYVSNLNLQQDLYLMLYNEIVLEQEKISNCFEYRNLGQEPGFDIKEELKSLRMFIVNPKERAKKLERIKQYDKKNT